MYCCAQSTFCAEANLTCIWRHYPPFTAVCAIELSKVELLQKIFCKFVTSTFVSHSHLQEVWTGHAIVNSFIWTLSLTILLCVVYVHVPACNTHSNTTKLNGSVYIVYLHFVHSPLSGVIFLSPTNVSGVFYETSETVNTFLNIYAWCYKSNPNAGTGNARHATTGTSHSILSCSGCVTGPCFGLEYKRGI